MTSADLKKARPTRRLALLVAGFLGAWASTNLAGIAAASPATDMMTQRIAAIGAGDVAGLAAAYAPQATLQWVGGPLDGIYGDAGAINTVWSKFAKAQGIDGQHKLQTRIVNLSEAGNPQGSTVAADMVLTGAKPLKVHYVTVWRNNKLVDEIWQINPQASY
ncbi:MAG TPA: nuclear transport factor 2 family protein [Terriglobia bacterium]|nr:nuclear transport factor 2 family protein [Terriglobia bacterium]